MKFVLLKTLQMTSLIYALTAIVIKGALLVSMFQRSKVQESVGMSTVKFVLKSALFVTVSAIYASNKAAVQQNIIVDIQSVLVV